MFGSFRRSRRLNFKHRSLERDLQTDSARVSRVADLLDAELLATVKERDGLQRRFDDLLARASISQGNDTDEYLTREEKHAEHLNRFDAQMHDAEDRLAQLEQSIAHFSFLKAEVLRRFPHLLSAGEMNT